jgi:endonuclease/exonuclease/phosphatase family metal-dependent hydrolase
VSVHLLTSNNANRNAEATSLVAQLGQVVADGDFLVIGGDFNTATRTEPCITTFGQIVDSTVPPPVDQAGNDNTNAPRSQPYDWVLASKNLGTYQVPTAYGASSFPTGLVFDSRVYTPLSDVAPMMKSDCEAVNMQHWLS